MATENERERMHGLPAPGRTPAARQDREAEAATVVSPPVAPGAAPAETAGGRPAARYVLGEEIGRGGLGRVVSALDSAFDREVALKLVHAGAPGEALARFRREARITGRLEHPHIVPAHDLGVLPGGGDGAGEPFFSMKRIRGPDMGRVIRELGEGRHEGPWTRRRLVEALRDVSLAVAFAHSRGVIHRDLKPSNIMLGDYGEVLVVDWGLAKVVGEPDPMAGGSGRVAGGRDLTQEGTVLGTPAYMPPEQAEGDLQAIDARSDVYALGAMLYEVLCYRPPFEGATAIHVIRQVRMGELVPPSRRLAPGAEAVPEALEAICLRAMARERRERYAGAQALADELTAWLEGAKDRERRARDAEAAVAEGERLRAEWGRLKAEVTALEAEVERLGKEVPTHAPVEAKRPAWEAEARLKGLRASSTETFGAASAAYGAALTAVSDHAAAREGKCALFFARYLEAERSGNDEERLLDRQLVRQYDPGGWAARLEPTGVLSVSTAAYACDCLRPLPAGVLAVRLQEECTVPWRGGRPCPGEALTDEDRPVPALTLAEGVRWGHGPGCERRPVVGATVRLSRYEEQGRRLRLCFLRELGTTPLADIELPGGSYLCELTHPDYAPVRLPVCIDRDGAWRQAVTLYRADEVPAGFCYVPGGPFRSGEEREGVGWKEARSTQDLFVARVAVTVCEYIEFLDDRDVEEARRRQPREGDTKFLVEDGGRFRLHREGEGAPVPLSANCPVLGVSWFDAVAYSAWRARRDGRPYRLLHEEEFEKAARGVDGRAYPWGDRYDGTFSNTIESHEAGPRPVPAGSFEADESPYGVRDLAGNMVTWCLNAPDMPFRGRPSRLLRGGTWFSTPDGARATNRRGSEPTYVYRNDGVRLALPPLSWLPGSGA